MTARSSIPGLVLALSLVAALAAAAAAQAPTFPHGHVHPLLHRQRLSHLALHSQPFQLHLAALFAPPDAVCIVGVEWGSDMRHFAEAGYRVHAVEAVGKYARHLQTLIDEHPHWHVKLHAFAAANASGLTIDVEYHGHVEQVATRRLDDLLSANDSLAALSVDIQGDELHVLQGASDLLPRAVASLWVEAFSCHDKVAGVLDLLDEHYVLFEFVPWGLSNAVAKEQKVPRTIDSFAFEPDRPSEFRPFLDWLCHARQTGFRWLQTDLLAVRRDLVDKAWPKLVDLAESQCGRDGVNCLFRKLHDEAGASSEHDEL